MERVIHHTRQSVCFLALEQPSVLEHHHAVRLTDRGQPVRNHQGRAPSESVAQCPLHLTVRFRVELARR